VGGSGINFVRAKNDGQALTAERFAGLLARLHADPEQSGLEYERLRRSLIKFFDWRGGWPPDECADECLDRLARRLAEQVPVLDVRHFALGIARLVLLERRRQPPVTSIGDATAVEASPMPGEPDVDSTLYDCFDRCLAEMPVEARAALLKYYEGERDRKIANRRRLSASLGLSENALRSRVQRLRDRLENCIHSCLLRFDVPHEPRS
jgi:DNA-directed RNA polymerase specialized sigma24 family protein